MVNNKLSVTNNAHNPMGGDRGTLLIRQQSFVVIIHLAQLTCWLAQNVSVYLNLSVPLKSWLVQF